MALPLPQAGLFLATCSLSFAPYAGAQDLDELRKLADPGAAYAAKRIGSAILVAGRSIESVLAEEFAPETQLERFLAPWLSPEVDLEAGEVQVELLGARWRAVLRPGFGVTLLRDDPDATPLQQLPELPPFPKGLADELWPIGDRLPGAGEEGEAFDRKALDEVLERHIAPHREEGIESHRRTRALLVLHQGHLVGERYGSGFGPDTRLTGWSMTKSVLSALVGIRIKQGELELEQTDLLPEWSGVDDSRSQISVLNLLRMDPGLQWDESYTDVHGDPAKMLFGASDTAAIAAQQPAVEEPGAVLNYSSGTSNILSLVLRRSFDRDEDYWQFPRQALFGRLGMRSAVFELDPSGTFIGSSFLWATARDWARFGLLYAQDGVWQGERIFPEGWVAATVEPAPAARRGQYGLHWWLNRGGKDGRRRFAGLPEDLYWADGFEGQMLAIFPSQEVIVLRLGCTKDGRLFRGEDLLEDVLRCF